MRIAITVNNGMIEDIDSDVPLPDDIEFIVVSNNIENAKPEAIGRVNGTDVLAYAIPAHHVEDRRFWRDVREAEKRADLSYADETGEYDDKNVIEGTAFEIQPVSGLLSQG